MTAAFQSYAGGELGYRTEQPYRVLARDVSRGWDWDAARGEGGLGIALSSLQDTLLLLPQTKVFVATGLLRSGDPLFRDALAARSARRAGSGAPAHRSARLRGRAHDVHAAASAGRARRRCGADLRRTLMSRVSRAKLAG